MALLSVDQSEREATSIECVLIVPLPVTEDLASSSLEELLSTRVTFMPWEAQSFATARPMPPAAPVMRALAFARKTEVGEAILVYQ